MVEPGSLNKSVARSVEATRFHPEPKMQSRDAQLLAEKRAYYRLLRRLLTEEVESAYKEAPPTALPANLSSLMNELEKRET